MKAIKHLEQAASLLKSSERFGGPMRHKRENNYRNPYPYRNSPKKGIYRARVFYDSACPHCHAGGEIPPRRDSITKVDISFQIMGVVMRKVKSTDEELVEVRITSMKEYTGDGGELSESQIARERPRFPMHSNVGKTVYIQFYKTDKKDLIWQRRVKVLDEKYHWFWGEDEWYLDMPYDTFFEHAWEKELQNMEFEIRVDEAAAKLSSW